MTAFARLSLVSLCLVIGAQGLARADDEPSIAVITPTLAPAAQEIRTRGYDSQDIVRLLEEGLRNSGRFLVFDRDKTNESSVLAEQAFAISGKAEGNAAEFGKLKNVNLIVQPTVTLFKSTVQTRELEENPGRFGKQEKAAININYKVLDTTTLQIKFALNLDAQLEATTTVASRSDTALSAETWQKLIQQITRKSVASIGERIFPIMVVRYQNKQLFLNRGDGAGLQVGDVKDVFSASEDMIDPSTGKSLGAAEDMIGKVRILRINPKFSIAVPIGDLSGEPKAGDILR